MKLYIAGKIAGLDPDGTRAKFAEAARALRIQGGHETLNPFNIAACATFDCNGYQRNSSARYEHNWECYLRHDIARFLNWADGVALLFDWTLSPGARLEQYVAVSCGLDVRPLEAWVPETTEITNWVGDKIGEVSA